MDIKVFEQKIEIAQIEKQKQQERSRLLAEVTLKIRQSLQLEEILQTAVTEVQKLLQAERVLVVQLNSIYQGTVIKESTLPNSPIMLGQRLVVPLFPADYIEKYRQGLSTASADLQQALTQPEEKALLRDFAIKASLNVPIFVQEKLWGLLVLHQCQNLRHWSEFEIALCRQLADQIGIALSQSQLLTQMEELVAERTEELAETNQHLEQEIEERLKVEKSLRQSQEQLQLITNALPVLISYVDTNQHYRFNNKAYEDWFGKPVTEICGCHIREVLDESTYEQIRDKIEAVLSGQNVTFEMEVSYKNDGSRWVEAIYIPHRDEEGTVLGFFALVKNITERKAMEKMKDEFISVVSHELRTPLTSIHCSLRLLTSDKFGSLDPKGQQIIDIADQNTTRLVRLVNDILDFERLNSGKVKLEKRPCRTADLILKAVEIMKGMAQEQEIVLSTVPTSLPLFADPDYTIQILTNLISNGIKFSPAKSTIWVQAENRETEILFQVKDQGRGIPSDKLDSIFNRFQQIALSDSRQKGGTGLGLAICRQIVELHGGKIWAESTLGKGSTFYFTLPKA
jgi:PAS domain S-box-containing protein